MTEKDPFEIRRLQSTSNGNSVQMIIPKFMAEALGIEKGSYVKIALDMEKGRIVLEALE